MNKREAWSSLLLAVCGVVADSQAAFGQNLLTWSDFQYQGAFRGPACNGANCLDGGGFAMGYRDPYAGHPKGTLFVSCNMFENTMAEIDIPAPVDVRASGNANLLPQAAWVQNCADPFGGAKYVASSGGQGDVIGGIIVKGTQLIVSLYSTYDANFEQMASHYVKSSLSIAAANAAGPYAVSQTPVVTNGKTGYTSGPMAWIPAAWRAAFGNKEMIAFNCCLSIGNRTSHGPAAFAFNAADLTSVSASPSSYPTSPAPSVPLLYYDEPHMTIGDPNAAWDGVNNFTNAVVVPAFRGAVIPDGTRSALFIGGAALGPNPTYGGTDCQNTHGYTAPPYRSVILSYDLNDWKNSAANPTANPPWATKPTLLRMLSSADAPFLDSQCDGTAGAAVYDPGNKLLYWVSAKHDPSTMYNAGPIIHVWKLNTSAAPAGTTAPAKPTGFRMM